MISNLSHISVKSFFYGHFCTDDSVVGHLFGMDYETFVFCVGAVVKRIDGSSFFRENCALYY